MKVIGISGSPRKNGNTEILLRESLKPFHENGWQVFEFYLSDKYVSPCDGCDSCLNSSGCIINDDMQFLYDEFQNFDAMIVASPAYYRNVTAQLKALIDRTYATIHSQTLKGKLGGAITVGRGEGGGQSLVLSIIHNFFLSSGMICIPGEINGVSARADKPGDILSQPKRLKQARILGENILEFCEKLNEH